LFKVGKRIMIDSLQRLDTGMWFKRFPAVMMTSLLSSAVWLSVGQPMFANDAQPVRWTPSGDRGQVGNTRSGGRRGQELAACNLASDSTRLTLLVPEDPSGLLTTSSHPTFAWFASTQETVDMQFVLMAPGQATPLYSKTLKVDQSGIISVALPETVELETGTRYRWTVISTCAGGTQQEIFARSFIERVAGESLEQSVNTASSLDRALTYAENGIWYDALSQFLMARDQEPGNVDITQGLEALLSQGMGANAAARLYATTAQSE
jgi:hypothetical protein